MIQPLIEKSIITIEDKDKLFCNFEELITLHKQFLTSFETTGLSSDSVIDFIGDVFIEFSAKYQEAYTRYCSHQFNLYDNLLLLQQSPKFNTFITVISYSSFSQELSEIKSHILFYYI